MIEVLQGGTLSTLQDEGRPGHRSHGVPTSGPMDDYSYRMANWLVFNEPGASVIEVVAAGLSLKFCEAACVGVCGAVMELELNGKAVPHHKMIRVKAGDQLAIGKIGAGWVSYVAVAGTMESEEFLGSTSTYATVGIGGLEGRPLRKGDRLELQYTNGTPDRMVPDRYLRRYVGDRTIRITEGPEADLLSEEARSDLFQQAFKVSSQSNRMGIRLIGSSFKSTAYDIPSRPVYPGTIQLTKEGPILLMSDGQTTGGYPRIAQVITADLGYCGQLAPANTVRFKSVQVDEAQVLKSEYLDRISYFSG